MTLEQLKNLPAAEVAHLSQEQSIVASAAQLEFQNQKAKADLLELAARCHQQGFWPGDLVQVKGKFSGKQDPMGIFFGFEANSLGWRSVRLLKKDGTPSEAVTCIYRNEATLANPQ